jgi:hypothetical protein
VDSAGYSIKGNGIVGCIGGEDGDGVAGAQGVDGCFVRLGIASIVRRERLKAGVEPVVDLRDVLMEMLAW